MAMLFVFDENINDFVCSKTHFGVSKGCGDVLWSHSRFLDASGSLCRRFDDLALKKAFAPLCPTFLSAFSPHYAGLAGDFALTGNQKNIIPLQNEIRRWCIKSGLFSRVEAPYQTPLWIHAEVEVAPPASFFVSYPQLFPGNIGPHVFILQKGLCLLGFLCLLSGRFDELTLRSLLAFKQRFGLAPDPWADALTWQVLFHQIKKAAKPPKWHSPFTQSQF